ncbi:MAG: hypothetical protein OXH52_22020 [Gammaproteobacteria bacterium]|nr:hypothetical protein [Gammaproteobacteria bacterium]
MSEPGLSPRVIDYPSSDGKPIAEGEAQFLPLTYAALAGDATRSPPGPPNFTQFDISVVEAIQGEVIEGELAGGSPS